MTKRRVLTISLDACDKNLLGKWAAEGVLPTIQKLQGSTAQGITSAPKGLFVGAVWPSMWTSLAPDEHGRYCYEQFKPGTYENTDITPRDTHGAPWWQQLSDA
jgi:predicted AlkP superfamily phosphohydrolase/phosphomutase